jgi:trimethylguanosine synthase
VSLTLGQALDTVAPRGFRHRVGWRALIRALRERRRATGAAGRAASLGAVERLLALPLLDPEDLAGVSALKVLLRGLTDAELSAAGRLALAAEADAAAVALVPAVVERAVVLHLDAWPGWADPADELRLTGLSGPLPAAVDPLTAATLIARLDGMALGGAVLGLRAEIGAGLVLPTVPRAARDASPRGRGPPWLPHLDEEGRFSLSPEPLAVRQAALLGTGPVIDLFLGCGGNAVAAARAGAFVHAVELDAARLDLARRNLALFGVGHRARLHRGDAAVLGPGLLARHPDAAVFLDPPWGGVDPSALRLTWDALLPDAALRAALDAHPARLVAKLPRAFDVSTLPPRAAPWRVRLDFGAGPGDDARWVKGLTAWSGPAGPGALS